MKLQEVFSQLAYGELSQHVLGSHVEGAVSEANYPSLVNHINLGLTALYKRFNLKEGREVIPLVSGQLSYPLEATDVLKIERVYTDLGYEMGLNDLANPYACSTPANTLLRVPEVVVQQSGELPEALKTTALETVYRANHPPLVLTAGYIDPLTTEVELPMSHLEALLYFVASRVNNPIGMGQEFNAGNNWFNRFEMECQRLEATNLRIDTASDNDRMASGGWV